MSEGTQRRLAAILAADVVDYSRLMEADDELCLVEGSGADAKEVGCLIGGLLEPNQQPSTTIPGPCVHATLTHPN